MTAPAITDPMTCPSYDDTAWHRLLAKPLRESRDVVFMKLTLTVLALLLPLLGLMLWRFHWGLLAVYMAINFWFVPPVILMLHNTMHRGFFKAQWLTKAHAYLMSALFGIATGYTEHHMGMHHAENNVGDDLSATYHYERDNFFHWLRYFARFIFFIEIELTTYFVRHGKPSMAVKAIGSDLVHLSLIAFMCWYDWRIGVFAFFLPWLVTRVGMMLGNWGQHAFIQQDRPQDSFANSLTCINSTYNARCFNDGYHIGHHIKPNRHWAELPKDFLDSLPRYAKEGCIVFKDVDFFFVSILLFLKRYDVLADKFVPMEGQPTEKDAIIALLKSRTRPVAMTVSLRDAATA